MAVDAQLYIDGQRIDLFSDESIQITSSIQNVRDIAKIFSDYSTPFAVKASRNNNVVFKHYHDGDIVDGFDARFRTDAVLELNYQPFRKGAITLNRVLMRNNKAYAYDINFYGSTATLTNILGEEKIDSLTYLDNYNHVWNNSNILTGLVSGLTLNSQSLAVIYPLISPEYRFIYDSTLGSVPAKTRNIADSTISDDTAGVHAEDLKPAIKLIHIIEAIEDRFPQIQFSRDFFGTSVFTELYMWMHREPGTLFKEVKYTEVIAGTYALDGLPVINCSQDFITLSSNAFSFSSTALSFNTTSCVATITVTPASAEEYGIRVIDTNRGNEVLYEENNISGTRVQAITLDGAGESFRTYNVQAIIIKPATSTLTTVDVAWGTVTTKDTGSSVCTNTKNFSITSALNLVGNIIVRNHLPDLKILDFLTCIFKMFNLTAYEEDGTIVVKTLDSYYAAGTSYDITQYVNVAESEVVRPPMFNEIEFKYKQPVTFLADEFKNRNNMEFGSEQFKVVIGDKYIDGTKYAIELPFEKMVYERLSDNNAAITETDATYGYFVDKDQNPVKGSPLIFYRANTTLTGAKYIYLKDIGDTGYSQIINYNRPSNVKKDESVTLNFGEENDEYALVYNDNSLFNNYYTNYVSGVFNERSRMLKISADLPLKILTKYKLNDRFIVNKVSYRINQITTNMMTNKSELELIRDL